MNKLFRFFAFVSISLMILCSFSSAQVTSVDTTFGAVPSIPIPSTAAIQHLVQPDGKIVAWGAQLVADGKASGDVVRLNANGTVDQTFSYCGCGLVTLSNVVLQPNGQLILAGAGQTAKMIRLNSDGSIDPSFVSGTPPNPFGASVFTAVAIQPDGKIFAYRRQAQTGFAELSLFRFNQDGSVDSGFSSIFMTSGSPAAGNVGGLSFLPDGRFYLAVTQGTFGSSSTLRRYNSDGSVDSTWETPSFSSGGFPTSVSINSISLESAGSLLVSGKWDTVNGLAKPNLIRLLSGGNVDLTFSPSTSLSGNGVQALSDGRILFSQLIDVGGIVKLYRLNSDGSLDKSFTMDPSVDSVANRWQTDSSGNIVFLGLIGSSRRFVRLDPNGGAEMGFAPNVTIFGSLNSILRQSDGKLLILGGFSQLNGTAKAGFARTDAEGIIDPGFDSGTGFNVVPEVLHLQSDGKILAVGGFTSYNGVERISIARINTDGSLDTSFAPQVAPSSVLGVATQNDGKIVITGNFTTVNGTARTKVARLESNGDLDGSFNPVVGSGEIYRTIVQSDGKIVIAGSFSGVNGFNRTNLVRLNSNGTLDETFNASSAGVGGLWIQPDGKLLTAGFSGSGAIARKNSDGSPDNGFTVPAFSANSSSDTSINSILVQPDASLLVGGRFDFVGGTARRNFTRLAPNGEFDPLFLINGANGKVRTIASAAGSKVLIGGEFSKVDLLSQPGISRLNISTFRRVTPFDFDGDGKADVSVFRPSENKWYILRSSDFGVEQQIFAISGDVPVASDFDGDGKCDMAIFRPSLGDWWYRSSVNSSHIFAHWGNSSDTPRPSDFDGDGRADYVVYRESANTWFRSSSANGTTLNRLFGAAGDKPLVGDIDGDGKSDVLIYRPSTGDWWWQSSIDNVQRATHWGISTDIPAPADFDGDGKTDLAVYRPSTGVWYILNSSTGQATIVQFGIAEDKPVVADYDGDGKADIAVFRPSTGIWYFLKSTEGFSAIQFGIGTDIPIENSFIQ